MKKNRFNTYLDEDLSKKMTAAMELSDACSESEFIRNAVEFYIGYIFSKKSADYLSDHHRYDEGDPVQLRAESVRNAVQDCR